MADSQIQSDDKKLQGQVQDVTDVMAKNIDLGNIYNFNSAIATKNLPYANLTNRSQYSGGEYESARFWVPTALSCFL